MGGLVSLGAGYGGHFHAPRPFNPNPDVGSGSNASLKGSLDEDGNAKKKIVPGSEVRVYGRGELPLLTQFLHSAHQNRGSSKYRQNSKG